MKISKHLPHFEEDTLLVVTGRQEAVVYLASHDEVRLVGSLKAKRPEPSDRGGRFGKRMGRDVLAGGTGDLEDEEQVRSFTRQLSDLLVPLAASGQAQRIYLFCPTYLCSRVEDAMSIDMRSKLEFVFFGNYQHQHPFVLLSKVQEHARSREQAGKVELIPPGALDILNKTGQGGI